MDERIKKIYEKYLNLASAFYGNLPKHCYETQFVIGEAPEDKNASCADCSKNILYINPQVLDKDLEWTIFHEMEHIRTAQDINKTQMTGLCYYLDKDENLHGECLNESLTEMSVEILLNRKQDKVGYYESIQLTRQLCVILGLSDEEAVLKFYKKDGKEEFEKFLEETSGIKCFDVLSQRFDDLHYYHEQDMEKEYSQYGKIMVKPLGMYTSEQTQKARDDCQQIMNLVFKETITHNNLKADEIKSRFNKFNEESPYKNLETNISKK